MPSTVNAPLLRSLWRTMPDRRTIVYKQRTDATPTYTNYTIREAWYRPDGTEEGAPSQGVYIRRYRRWYFPKEKFTSTIAPAPADLIVNTATTIDTTVGTWTVLRQTEAGALGAWELGCVMLEVRGAFAVTVNVERRTNDQDATGRILPTTQKSTGTTGWLQPADSEAMPDLLGKLQMPTKGIVYLAETLSFLATDTIMINDVSYNIVEVSDPLHLEELQSVRIQLAR